jgi:preprotein translocase subunit SecB
MGLEPQLPCRRCRDSHEAGLGRLATPNKTGQDPMADATKGGKKNGQPGDPERAPPAPIEVQVLGQYIKDLSFENPSIGKLLEGPGENPNISVEVNVGAGRKAPDIYESGINFKAHASNKTGIIYDLELLYTGLFKIKNIPEHALEPFLLINCPTLIFPFLRRLVADITREGGFPPLLLDPIDFAGLFVRRQQAQASSGRQAN